MKDPVAPFLLAHYDSNRPVLLALSGGPDSLALLHLLIDFRSRHPLAFGIAHVDHGWRVESSDEAAALQQRALDMGIPFHLKKLDPALLKGNLESACRDERLRFFQELCPEHNYQAVLLGHHADDLVETVLKRLFEGSRLTNLAGLQEVGSYQGMPLWRPLLKVHKQEILEWLKARGLSAFEDCTNSDNRYLRARMRETLLPFLDQHFGKKIGPSLLHLSQEAAALRSYLHERIKPHHDAITYGKWGLMVDLTALPELHPYELREFVRHFAEIEKFPISRENVELTASLLKAKAANKRVVAGDRTLEIDRGRLFLPRLEPLPFGTLILTEGTHELGPWTVTVAGVSEAPASISQGWEAAWRGLCAIALPQGDYRLAPIPAGTPYRGSTPIDKWWNNHKVPAFVRSRLPGIWRGEELIHEFLTKKRFSDPLTYPFIQIKIQN